MRFRVPGRENDDVEVARNRTRFLRQFGATLGRSALVYVTYDTDDFTRFRRVDERDAGSGMKVPGSAEPADGLATSTPELALFLPLADCNGVILYDENQHALMVAHLGRHTTVEEGAKKAVGFMENSFGTDPSDLYAWLSPAVGKDSYAMEAAPKDPAHFNFAEDPRWEEFRTIEGDKVYIDLAGYNRRGLEEAGVESERIEVCAIDTAADPRYPSHSSGDLARYAITAVLR